MSGTFAWSNIFKKQEDEDVRDILARVPIFEGLGKSDLKSIERILHRREYKTDEVVFHAGDMGVGMYIIEHGLVGIVSEKTERQVALLTDGEFFGEMALLTEEPRGVRAIARSDTSVYGFFQSDLNSLLEKKPRLGISVLMRLARVLSRRLQYAINENQRLYDRIAELTAE